MRHSKLGLALAGLAAFFLVACGGGGGSSSSSSSSSGGSSNSAPTANAGSAQTVYSGATVTLSGSGTDSDGTIASYAWSQTAGTTVTLSSTTVAQPTFTAPTVSSATTLTFSLTVKDNDGASSAASTVNITVNPPVAGIVTVTGRVRFARVNFSSSSPYGLMYGSPTLQPSRGVLVRALDASSNGELATGSTDANGDYSLSVSGSTNITIEVVARMQRTGTAPTWDVRVQNGTSGTNPYTYETSSFNSGAGVTQDIDIPTGINSTGSATSGSTPRASGPFAILDTIYTAQQTVLGAAPSLDFPSLIVDWGSQTEGTFFTTASPQHIALLAALGQDTDEFDQHVVAHEFGHYVEHNFSRADSIGGSHGLGDRLDPRVAFGEGFGYAFAAIVLGNSNSRDSYVSGGTQVSGGFDIEDNPPASNDPSGCWCSESSVWSILYDVADSNADTDDSLALGFAPMWNVLIGTERTTPAFTTLFSFMSALKDEQPASASAIDTLIAGQNVSTDIDAFATNETHYPSEVAQAAALPLYTTVSFGSSYTLKNVNDAGHYNTLGNHRYARFDVSSTRNVTVTLSSSNTNTADPDFVIYKSGEYVTSGEQYSNGGAETLTFSVTAGTYLIDAYDCANGCYDEEGTPGDYDLTLTVN